MIPGLGFLMTAANWLTGTKAGRIVLVVLAVLTGGLIYRSRLIKKGEQNARQKANEEARERKERTDTIEREVDGMTGDELDKEGEPWVRR